jgi:hypothetical protein
MACSQSWPRLFAQPGHEARTHRIRCKATIPSKDDGKQDDRKQTLQQIFAHCGFVMGSQGGDPLWKG